MSECSIDRLQASPGGLTIPASSHLADHTTLRVGGPADNFVVAETERELIDVVTDCDERKVPVLVLGGGSNLLVSDEGFPGTVVRVAMTGVKADVSTCGGAAARVAAGENWDDFVAYAVDQEWAGIEMLSGIPGSVGATPIQNVGAYGSDVSHTVTFVRTWDRHERTQTTFPVSDCAFGYRTSRFKREPGRYLVLEVGFQFPLGSLGSAIAYPELARHLGTETGRRMPAKDVREAVLAIRASKGMVLDAEDHDTWSAGSFFTNPILSLADAANLPDDAPASRGPTTRSRPAPRGSSSTPASPRATAPTGPRCRPSTFWLSPTAGARRQKTSSPSLARCATAWRRGTASCWFLRSTSSVQRSDVDLHQTSTCS